MEQTSFERNVPLLDQRRTTVKPSTPLFIVGSPRSGTKLLRTLLNNHPDISLGGEGHYIPLLVTRVGKEADLSQRETWRQVYATFTQNGIYRAGKKRGLNFSEAELLRSYDDVVTAGETPSWAHALETLVRAYSPRVGTRVWGDKSHGYLYRIPLLRELLPGVRFLHIVRDPRDQVLSAQRAWGKHPLRSAQMWLEAAREAERLDLTSAADTLVVRYEDLTDDPAGELKRISHFLGVPWMEEIATLTRPSENLGDTRGRTEVVAQKAKYRDTCSPQLTRRISEIALPYLERYGYPTEGVTVHRPLTKMQLKGLRYLDGLASLRFHMREKGALTGARLYWRRRHQATASRAGGRIG